MGNIYVTSDQHFSHPKGRIIEYCNRPYANVDEMDADMIDKWNSVVTDEDEVYHLGDFCLSSLDRQQSVFQALRGRKYLVLGNHDGSKFRMEKVGFEVVAKAMDLHYKGQFIYMVLNPDHYQNILRRHHDIVLYGHQHNTPSEKHGNMDGWVNCCVENWNYTPVLLDTLIEKGNQWKLNSKS